MLWEADSVVGLNLKGIILVDGGIIFIMWRLTVRFMECS